MKKIRLFNLWKLVFVLFFTFLFFNSNAIYLGWNQNKLDRYLNRHVGYKIEQVKQLSSNVTYVFERGDNIIKMIFYFNMEGSCFAYSIIYDIRYGDELTEFIHRQFTYNKAEDYFENNRSKLYYEGGRTKHEIYVTDKRANDDSNIGMK